MTDKTSVSQQSQHSSIKAIRYGSDTDQNARPIATADPNHNPMARIGGQNK